MISTSVILGKNTTIRSTAIIEGPAYIGDEALIEHYVIIRPEVYIGACSQLRQYCFVAGKVTIGKQVKIFQYSNISKGSIIHDRVYVGPRVLFMNTRKISHGRSYDPVFTSPIIEKGARIGGGVVLLPGVTIGQECMIGAGSVVTADTEPFWVYVGNPAKKLRIVPENERLVW